MKTLEMLSIVLAGAGLGALLGGERHRWLGAGVGGAAVGLFVASEARADEAAQQGSGAVVIPGAGGSGGVLVLPSWVPTFDPTTGGLGSNGQQLPPWVPAFNPQGQGAAPWVPEFQS